MVIRFKYLILAFLLIIKSFPQTEDILQKESELSSLKSEITKLEQELTSKSAAEIKSFEAVENLNKQNYLINKMLSRLRSEIKNKEKNLCQSL